MKRISRYGIVAAIIMAMFLGVAAKCSPTENGPLLWSSASSTVTTGCERTGEQTLHNATDVPSTFTVRWQPKPGFTGNAVDLGAYGVVNAPCYTKQISVAVGQVDIIGTLQDGTGDQTWAKFTAVPYVPPTPADINVNFAVQGKSIDQYGNSITTSTYGENGVDIVRSTASANNIQALGAQSSKIPLRFNAANTGDAQVYSSAGGGPGPRPGGVNGIEWITKLRSIGIEPQIVLGGLNGDNDYDAAQARGMFKYFKDRGQTVTNWIIGNEPGDASSPAYCDKFASVVDALRAEAGATPLSIAGHTLSHYNRGAIRQFLADPDCGGKANVLDFHDYAMGGEFIPDPYPADSATTTKRTSNWATEVSNTYADIAELQPGRNIVVQVGELNWSWQGADGYGGSCDPAHVAPNGFDERFYCAHNRAWSASVIGHIITSGGRALVYADNNGPLGIQWEKGGEAAAFGRAVSTPMPIYWGIKAFNGFSGKVVQVSESLSDVDVFASSSGKIIIVNRRSTAVNFSLQLQNIIANSATVRSSVTSAPFDAPASSNISVSDGRINGQVAGLGVYEVELNLPA